MKEYKRGKQKEQIELFIISKKEANEIKQTWYFTGVPCVNNHIDRRYCKSNKCYTCHNENHKKNIKNNPDTAKRKNARRYAKVKIDKNHIERTTKWRKENKDRFNELQRKKPKDREKCNAYQRTEKYKEWARSNSKKKSKNPFYRLCRNISKGIAEALSGKKANRSWKEIVDYTQEELKLHLELKFKPEMNWENYGSYWHVDHIRPISWFNFDCEEEVKKAWKLSNLQPLEASENSRKRNYYEG